MRTGDGGHRDKDGGGDGEDGGRGVEGGVGGGSGAGDKITPREIEYTFQCMFDDTVI